MPLNDEQEKVASHLKGRAWVVAGPGSGKTSTITERIGRLLQAGVNPFNILAITFTNKACDEMKVRMTRIYGESVKPLEVRTFHSLCVRILRWYGEAMGYGRNMVIWDDGDQKERMRTALRNKVAVEAGNNTKDENDDEQDKGSSQQKINSLCWICNDWREKLGRDSDLQEYIDEGKIDDIEASAIREYMRRMKDAGAIDFAGLLSETYRLLKSDEEARNALQSRFQYIQVDEYQDTNYAQNQIIELLVGPEDNVLAVGDPDQCQPGDTLVRTKEDGDVRIDALKPGLHTLLSFSSRSSAVLGWKNGLPFNISARPYRGPMAVIEVAGVGRTKCTPNHKWTAKLVRDGADQWHAVYLMRRGECWRVGRTQMFRKTGELNESGESSLALGPAMRARQEGAEAVWVLRLFSDKAEAQIYEQIVSLTYSIPTLCFKSAERSGGEVYEQALRRLYQWLPKLLDGVHLCLRNHGRDISHPFWQKRSSGASQKVSRRLPFVVHTCNLIPEVMQIPVPTKGKSFEWKDFVVGWHDADCMVYSLDVARHEHYIADGIITHNSIYRWRGASPEGIQNFIKAGKNGCATYVLGTNYRSTPEIISWADTLIKNNKNRHPIEFKTANASNGMKPVVTGFSNPEEEARTIANKIEVWMRQGVDLSQIAIFYRMNDLSRAVEQALSQRHIPNKVVGGQSFYDRMEIKDCMSMLRLLVNGNDGAAFTRLASRVVAGLGEKTIGQIELYSHSSGVNLISACDHAHEYMPQKTASQKGRIEAIHSVGRTFHIDRTSKSAADCLMEMVTKLDYKEWLKQHAKSDEEAAERARNVDEMGRDVGEYMNKNPGSTLEDYLDYLALKTSGDDLEDEKFVTLMSGHKCKGTEFDCVFAIGIEEKLIPNDRAVRERPEFGMEEERCVMYVMATRARKFLSMSWCKERKVGYGQRAKIQKCSPSRFLVEAGSVDPADKAKFDRIANQSDEF